MFWTDISSGLHLSSCAESTWNTATAYAAAHYTATASAYFHHNMSNPSTSATYHPSSIELHANSLIDSNTQTLTSSSQFMIENNSTDIRPISCSVNQFCHENSSPLTTNASRLSLPAKCEPNITTAQQICKSGINHSINTWNKLEKI